MSRRQDREPLARIWIERRALRRSADLDGRPLLSLAEIRVLHGSRVLARSNRDPDVGEVHERLTMSIEAILTDDPGRDGVSMFLLTSLANDHLRRPKQRTEDDIKDTTWDLLTVAALL